MDLTKQRHLIIRIQADLRKEAVMLHDNGNDMAMTDCDNQADALDFVVDSLRLLQQIKGVVTALHEGKVDG